MLWLLLDFRSFVGSFSYSLRLSLFFPSTITECAFILSPTFFYPIEFWFNHSNLYRHYCARSSFNGVPINQRRWRAVVCASMFVCECVQPVVLFCRVVKSVNKRKKCLEAHNMQCTRTLTHMHACILSMKNVRAAFITAIEKLPSCRHRLNIYSKYGKFNLLQCTITLCIRTWTGMRRKIFTCEVFVNIKNSHTLPFPWLKSDTFLQII